MEWMPSTEQIVHFKKRNSTSPHQVISYFMSLLRWYCLFKAFLLELCNVAINLKSENLRNENNSFNSIHLKSP